MNRHKVTSTSCWTRWMPVAAVSVTLATGCSLANKQHIGGTSLGPTRVTVNSKDVTKNSMPIESSATPGTPEFSVGKKLQNPIKLHLTYALWNEQQGNQVEARKSYDAVLEKQPKNIEAMMGLARLDTKLNRMKDAEEKLLRAQKIAPKSAEVESALSALYATQQDMPRALKHIESARRLSPYDPAVAHQLGIVQAKTGDIDGALASFTESSGSAGKAHYNLGVILHEQGDGIEAERHLQQALSLEADHPQAHQLLSTIRQARATETNGIAKSRPVNPPSDTGSTGIQRAAYSQTQQE